MRGAFDAGHAFTGTGSAINAFFGACIDDMTVWRTMDTRTSSRCL